MVQANGQKEICCVRKSRFGRRYRACQFGIAIREKKNVLVVLSCFRKRSKYTSIAMNTRGLAAGKSEVFSYGGMSQIFVCNIGIL